MKGLIRNIYYANGKVRSIIGDNNGIFNKENIVNLLLSKGFIYNSDIDYYCLKNNSKKYEYKYKKMVKLVELKNIEGDTYFCKLCNCEHKFVDETGIIHLIYKK